MEENKKGAPEQEDVLVYTLQDEDGTEYQFELIATYEKNGIHYFAMTPVLEEGEAQKHEFLEYTILKGVMENGEESLVSIDDDDEFEDIAAYFDNLFSEEIDYDAPQK